MGLRPSGSFDCAQDDGFVVLWAKDKQRQGVRGAGLSGSPISKSRYGAPGDGGVEHLHEGGQGGRERDGPGVVFGFPVEGVGHGCFYCSVALDWPKSSKIYYQRCLCLIFRR